MKFVNKWVLSLQSMRMYFSPLLNSNLVNSFFYYRMCLNQFPSYVLGPPRAGVKKFMILLILHW